MKRTIQLIVLLVISLSIPCAAGTERLQLVKTIGDDRDDYTIFGLADAEITDSKDIYILNSKANYVAHYDWEGHFKRRLGQRGQGPGDFSFPWGLAYYGDNLYVNDRGNRRLVGINLGTGKFSYIKQIQQNALGFGFSMIDGQTFIAVFGSIRDKRGRVGIFDSEFNITHTFFNHYPVDSGFSDAELTDSQKSELMIRQAIISSYTQPVFGVDGTKREVLVSFACPHNPVDFYLYNVAGKLLKKFSYTIEDKRYRYPEFFLTAPLTMLAKPDKYPDRFMPRINTLAIYKEHFVIFLSLDDHVKNEKVRSRQVCLIFDRNGKLKEKFPLGKGEMIFNYSNGYFLGRNSEDDDTKLYIYKLNIK